MKLVLSLIWLLKGGYSLEKPHKYVQSNLVGFFNVLELSENIKLKNFLYASSSSVYGE